MYIRLLAAGLLLGLGSIAQSGMAQTPAPAPVIGTETPCGDFKSAEQLADGRMTFRLCAPRASEVVVMSEMPSVPYSTGLAMSKDAQGIWSATTPVPVLPDTYRYSFKVDGVVAADPMATTFAVNRFGSVSTTEVTGPDGDYQSYDKAIPHGTVGVVEYWSASLGAKRQAHVYLPPGYLRDSRNYPVLYLVHGFGDSDDGWTSIGHAHYILDNLIAAGKAKPMIVVMPFGHTPGNPMTVPPPGRSNVNHDFGNDLLNDLVPFVDANFRTLRDPDHRAMAGLSMGGGHTLQFGLTHPEVFHYIGIFSIGLRGDEAMAQYEKDNAQALRQSARDMKVIRYYVGKRDPLVYTYVAPTVALLRKYGLKIDLTESGGAHTWINWRRYLLDFAPYLFSL